MCVLGGIGVGSLLGWIVTERTAGVSGAAGWVGAVLAATRAQARRSAERVRGLHPGVRLGFLVLGVGVVLVLLWSSTATPGSPTPA
jgi:hypothetical protein